MISNFSVDSIPPFRRREKRDSLHVRPKRKSRLDGYRRAKRDKENIEAGDHKKRIPQSASEYSCISNAGDKGAALESASWK